MLRLVLQQCVVDDGVRDVCRAVAVIVVNGGVAVP